MKKTFTKSIRIGHILVMFLIGGMSISVMSQTSHVVDVTNNLFTPDEITIMEGDTVIWTNSLGRHNVNGTQSKFPANPESFGNSVGEGWVFSHVFTIPGMYDYQCDPHVQSGMTGKVMVEALPRDTLTINFMAMTPHVGQQGWLVVSDETTGEEVERSSGIIEETFSLKIAGIVVGHDLSVEIFVDFNSNGFYDAPPVDHAWRFDIEDAVEGEVLDFTHNTDFTDIAFEHRAIVNLSGMTPHLGQDIYFALVDSETGDVIDMRSEIVVDSFSIDLSELMPGKSYHVDFYTDHNNNGYYDTPPADHAWRHEIVSSMGDDTLNFVHNTDFTDVRSTFGSDISLAEDAELGLILTDKLGFTLYYFTKDALPETSLCTGGCVDNWPLFYAEEPDLGDGLDMDDFGFIEHPEGGMQTTYKGWPLYYWVNDLNPGETKGEAVGNVWFVAKPDYSIMLMDGLLIGKDGVTYDSNYSPGEEMVQYFVDEHGNTLYIFVNDTYDQNNFTSEDFSNNGVWPVYEEELMAVASTLDESLFGSIDVFGHMQLTYKGWPLYYFGEDSQRGHTTGVSVPSPGVWPVAVPGLDEAPSDITSVEDLDVKTTFEIYPNPTFSELTITSDDAIESVSVINMMGAILMTEGGLSATEHRMSLEGISPGMYLLEVRTLDNKAQFSRLIKR